MGRVQRKVLPPQLTHLRPLVSEFVAKQTGLEVGGPSDIFRRRGLLPVYKFAAHLDNCNFSSDTVWEGRITRDSFRYDPWRAPGKQYFAEASALTFAADASYGFALSSHTLEHSANPLQCLLELQRVLRPGGALILVLPHKDATFDHKRAVTPLEHLIDDFERQTQEDDLSHLPEILALHDLERDPHAGNYEQFAARSQHNLVNRCLHQHVFDTQAAAAMVDWAGFGIHTLETALPAHILIMALKPRRGTADSRRMLSR